MTQIQNKNAKLMTLVMTSITMMTQRWNLLAAGVTGSDRRQDRQGVAPRRK